MNSEIPIITVVGYAGGSMEIYETKVVINKSGLAAFAAKGSNQQVIFMRSVTGVNVKKPSLLKNGQIEILHSGQNVKQVRDANVVIFRKSQLGDFTKAATIIQDLVAKI